MAKRPTTRRTSAKQGKTPALIWIGGGGLGVAAMIFGVSVLTHEPSNQATNTANGEPVQETHQTNASKAAAPQSTKKRPSTTAVKTAVHTQKIRHLPAARQPVLPPRTPSPTSPSTPAVSKASPASPPPTAPPSKDLAAYFYNIEAHRADRNDYVKGMMDAPVEWVGFIKLVNRRQSGATVLLTPIQSNSTFDIAYIDFPQKLAGDVESLARMDKVRIKGLYRGGGPMPHVDGTSIQLVADTNGP